MKKVFGIILSIFIVTTATISAAAISPRATKRVNTIIPADSIVKVGTPLSMEANELITINCTYSPRTADVDFGLRTPQNKFVYISGENGDCYQVIRVTETGSYYFAIRNNTSEPVEVLGYLYY